MTGICVCPWWDCSPPKMPDAPKGKPCLEPTAPPVYALPTSRGKPKQPDMVHIIAIRALKKYENEAEKK